MQTLLGLCWIHASSFHLFLAFCCKDPLMPVYKELLNKCCIFLFRFNMVSWSTWCSVGHGQKVGKGLSMFNMDTVKKKKKSLNNSPNEVFAILNSWRAPTSKKHKKDLKKEKWARVEERFFTKNLAVLCSPRPVLPKLPLSKLVSCTTVYSCVLLGS